MRRSMLTAFTLVAALASAACGAGSGASPRPDPSVITQAEIAAAGVSDAYQLVERLRPISEPRTCASLFGGLSACV